MLSVRYTLQNVPFNMYSSEFPLPHKNKTLVAPSISASHEHPMEIEDFAKVCGS